MSWMRHRKERLEEIASKIKRRCVRMIKPDPELEELYLRLLMLRSAIAAR